jgi:hypothetical protein
MGYFFEKFIPILPFKGKVQEESANGSNDGILKD